MSRPRPHRWRILAVFCGPALDCVTCEDESGCGAIEEFSDLSGSDAEVHVLRHPTQQELSAQLQQHKPSILYVSAGPTAAATPTEATVKPLQFPHPNLDGSDGKESVNSIASLVAGLQIECVYFDATVQETEVEELRRQDVRSVIYWREESGPKVLHAMQFGHAFFSILRDPLASITEAFAVASDSVQTHCSSMADMKQQAPSLPMISSTQPPARPTNASIPAPTLEDVDLSNGIAAAVPGWEDVRLLAPHAELRLLACGHSSLIDAHRLTFLGEALRALLVLEMRFLRVVSSLPCDKVPAHLPAGSTAMRCTVSTASGAHATVVLGGPQHVLRHAELVEHALRQTLVADSLSLQFKLPPPGVPAPVARTSSAVAGGTPVVDALVVTSVWAVHVLRTLSQDSSYRGLVALGVGAVGGTTVSAFGSRDTRRFNAILNHEPPSAANGLSSDPEAAALPGSDSPTQLTPSAPSGPASYNMAPAPARPPLPLHGAAPLAELHHSSGSGGSGGMAAPMEVSNGTPAAPPAPAAHPDEPQNSQGAANGASAPRTGSNRRPQNVCPWKSHRKPMDQCTEEEFLEDVCAFMRERRNKNVTPDNFPDAILNGTKLDLYNLYKEVCQRGGYRVGNGINWKGQVFPQMSNFTSSHKMTGVGNALKRHYQLYLWEYEQAHPEDVTGDLCGICGGGDEVATDWISCDSCDAWVHFSCDPRPYLGAFKDYAKGDGRSYVCIRCHENKRPRMS